MNSFDDLPSRPESHELDQLTEAEFQIAIKSLGLFAIQGKDSRDYGVDIQLEVCVENMSTNIRRQVQLKGTRQTNADGSVSVSVQRTNLNYLLTQPDSLYVCFHVPSGRLLGRYASDVMSFYESSDSNWRRKDSVTVRFMRDFDPAFQRELHARAISQGRSERDRRNQWAITPPAKMPSLVRNSIPPIEVPAEQSQAMELLSALYQDGNDLAISESFDRFAAVLRVDSDAFLPVFMAEVNLAINGGKFSIARLEDGIERIRAALFRGRVPLGHLLYSLGNALLAVHEYEDAVSAFDVAIKELRHPSEAPVAAMCWKNMGAARQKLGDYLSAAQAFEHALSLDPDLPEAHLELAVYILNRGECPHLALEHLDQVVGRRESALALPLVQAWRAEALFRTGDANAAFREINNLLTSSNRIDWVWPNCARLITKYGRISATAVEKSIDFWRGYLRIHPNDERALAEQRVCFEELLQTGRSTESESDSGNGL